MQSEPIHPAVRPGHVHLLVADIGRSLAFYRDALGFQITADGSGVGLAMVFLAAGDYHHHVAINAIETAGSAPPPRGHTGLYHVAFVYPDRRELGIAVRRVLDHGFPIDHASDHGATVSVYLNDPDENGIELYYDRPRAAWYDEQGHPIVKREPFDYMELVRELR